MRSARATGGRGADRRFGCRVPAPASGPRTRMSSSSSTIRRSAHPLRDHLARAGVATRPYYDPAIPDLTAFSGIVASADRSRDLARRSFAVPIHGRLSDARRRAGRARRCCRSPAGRDRSRGGHPGRRSSLRRGDQRPVPDGRRPGRRLDRRARSAARADATADPPIVWVDDQAAFEPDLPILPAIGSVARRGIVERLVGEGRALATFVHPSAVVAPSAVLEPGCVVFPNVVVGARTRIGRGTIVNRGALIGHHTTIGAFGFVGPGANIAGKVVDRRRGPCRDRGDRARRIDGRGRRDHRGRCGRRRDVAAGTHGRRASQPGRWSAMTDELIINLAPTGMVPTRADSPHVPLTPAEVAADVRRCADLGASIVHLHPRDDDGDGRARIRPSSRHSSARSARPSPDIVDLRHDERADRPGTVGSRRGARSRGRPSSGDGQPDPRLAQLPEAGVDQRAGHVSPALRPGCASAASSQSGRSSTSGCSTMRPYLRTKGLLGDPVYVNLLLGSLGDAAGDPVQPRARGGASARRRDLGCHRASAGTSSP